MPTPISKAAVLGAGVMGSGIAAHLANAGIAVELLDIVPKSGDGRNAIAQQAIARMKAADPAPLMEPGFAKRIRPGNLEDHLDRLRDCDLIIEAVTEDLAIKQALYRNIDPYRKAGSIMASNTSTLKLSALIESMPERFRADFMITHFFNPPRYMRLLEIVAGPDTKPDAIARMTDFADRQLGKGVVQAKDTPGFVANRIGVYWMQTAVNEARAAHLTIEEADALMGAPLGMPKTGVFGLLDLVGLDLMPLIDRSMAASLSASDPYHAQRQEFPLLTRMIADGYTGRKGKGGFYRLAEAGGKRVKEAIDLKTGVYAPAQKPQLDAIKTAKRNMGALFSYPDTYGRYVRRVMCLTLAYAVSLVPEITDKIEDVDRAMKLGFNWRYGPFEMIDRIGPKIFAQYLAQESIKPPVLLQAAVEKGSFYRVDHGDQMVLGLDGTYGPSQRIEGHLRLADVKRMQTPLLSNSSASLWDIGDGVTCLEFHSKMNAIDPDILGMVRQSLDVTAKKFKAMIIYNDGENFSVGANIGLSLFAANLAMWPMIDDMIGTGQNVYRALKFAPFPVIGAPAGLALGGGCEILLHCSAVQAHAETYMGLVETGVGIVPGWGGCKEMLLRFSTATMLGDQPMAKGPMPAVMKAFEIIALAKVSRSAYDAQLLGYLKPSDSVTMNRDRLLLDAKAKALGLLTQGYKPPSPRTLTLPGPSGALALRMGIDQFAKLGQATPYDRVVTSALADILSGGESDLTQTIGEDDILKLERKAVGKLLRQTPTLARMEHMLETGKPLRN